MIYLEDVLCALKRTSVLLLLGRVFYIDLSVVIGLVDSISQVIFIFTDFFFVYLFYRLLRYNYATIIMEMSITSFRSINICFIYFEALLLDTYTFRYLIKIFIIWLIKLLLLWNLPIIPDNFPCIVVYLSVNEVIPTVLYLVSA